MAPKGDQNAPKKPLTAYFLFMADERPKLMKAQPDLKGVGPFGKAMGERWANADEDTKAMYTRQNAEAKKKYDAAFAEYKKTDAYAEYQAAPKAPKGAKGATKDGKVGKKAGKDLDAKYGKPKRGLAGYFLFTNEVRASVMAEHPGIKVTEVGSKIAVLWKALDEPVRSGYEQKGKKGAAEATAALAEWQKTDEGKQHKAELKVLQAAAKGKAAPAPSKRKAPTSPKAKKAKVVVAESSSEEEEEESEYDADSDDEPKKAAFDDDDE